MRISCSHCRKQFDIPRERLPFGKIAGIRCPNCGRPMAADLQRVSGGGRALTPEPGPDRAPAAPQPPPSAPTGRGEQLKEQILRSLKELPPMPQAVFKAQEVIADGASDLKSLSRVIETDPALVMKILKIANSTFYGLSGKVGSVERATALLGQKIVGEIVAMASVSKLLESKLGGYSMASGDLWLHSMAVAFASKSIAGRNPSDPVNECFIAGLLHDVGKIVLNGPILERKKAFDRLVEEEDYTVIDAEQAVLGFDHADIAFEMCRRWKIPDAIANAIRCHHRPSRSGRDRLAYMLHLSDYIASLSGIGIGPDDIRYETEYGTLDFLGINQKTVSDIVFKLMGSVIHLASAH